MLYIRRTNIVLVINQFDHQINQESRKKMEATAKQARRIRSLRKINPISPFLCKIGLQLLTFCAVAWSYGNFTDGLPEYYDYEHLMAVSHSFAHQLCYVFGGVDLIMIYFKTNWQKLADSLHQKNPFLSWAVFFLIMAFIAHVGNFHQKHY